MKRFLYIIIAAASLATTINAQPKHLTVKQFLRLSQSDTASYCVSGTVETIRNSYRGTFTLKDATGTLLVYGLSDPAHPDINFSKMDIVQGDTVTVLGRFTIYNSSTKEMKDGRLISKAHGPDHNKSFYQRLEKRPAFKGKEGEEGIVAFKKWVQANLNNPTGARGQVVVHFVIGRTGMVQEVQIEKGASPAMNEEALRVVRSSPKWKPARMDGNPIRMNCTITVDFI